MTNRAARAGDNLADRIKKIDHEIEERINRHLESGLEATFREDVKDNLEMANQWIDTLSNFRALRAKETNHAR
jgi:hypothetical protein